MKVKLKASIILTNALALIESGEQRFACAAIQDVETTMRWETNNDVSSKAQSIFDTFAPKTMDPRTKGIIEWWPKGDQRRIDALKQAIEMAKKRND